MGGFFFFSVFSYCSILSKNFPVYFKDHYPTSFSLYFSKKSNLLYNYKEYGLFIKECPIMVQKRKYKNKHSKNET